MYVYLSMCVCVAAWGVAAAAFCKQLQTNARISLFSSLSIPFQVRIQSERTVNCKHIQTKPNRTEAN